MRVAIPSAVVLLACAGVAFAALHPTKVHPGKSDKLQTGTGHFAIEEVNPETARPAARPIFRPQRDGGHAPSSVEPVRWNPSGSPAASGSSRFVPADCPAPCGPVSAGVKQLLDATGRTLVGAKPPRNTTFVQAVVEEAKRELMW
jgi:hypothetical protein